MGCELYLRGNVVTLDGEAEPVAFDEDARWLRVRRGGHELAMNFAREPREVEVDGHEVVLATHDAELRDGRVTLPPLAGALVR